MDGTEKANFCLGSKGMMKKKFLRFTTIRDQFRGICEGAGSPGCQAPMVCIVALTALRSYNNRHFPVAFLGIVNIGVFQGLLVGSMWPAFSCSCINS